MFVAMSVILCMHQRIEHLQVDLIHIIMTTNQKGGEPNFIDLDNPGGWDDYTYQPKHDSRDKDFGYLGHFLPTGVTVVPKIPSTGKRFIDDYEFFYNGWKGDHERRNGATVDNLFPILEVHV